MHPAAAIARLARAVIFAAGAMLLVAAAAPAAAQDTANSGAGFWLQERARILRVRPTQQYRPPTRVRRLVPHRTLARPTIWRRPVEHHPAALRQPGAEPPEFPRTQDPPAFPATAPADAAPRETVDAPRPSGPPVANVPQANVPRADVPQADPPRADIAPRDAPAPAVKLDAAPPAPAQPDPALAAPAGAALPVVVVGDSLAYMLAQGLTEAAAERPGFSVVRKTKESSGLVREDFYDWGKALRDILAGPERIGAVVLMIGSNDRQELRDEAGRHEPLSPRWLALYAARVGALADLLKERKVPFLWVGMPIMKYERYSADIGKLNEIYRDRAEAAGGRYVDVWDAFADEAGRYSAFGPDVAGQIVKLRASDGVHFTRAGARKLAHFVEQRLRALIDLDRKAPPPVAALPPQPDAASAPQAAPTPQAAPAPIVKPLAGPVLPLTAAPLTGDTTLAGRTTRSGVFRNAPSPELAEGRTPAPKAGRADDFAWPKP
mgnify:CR=1 FL=1